MEYRKIKDDDDEDDHDVASDLESLKGKSHTVASSNIALATLGGERTNWKRKGVVTCALTILTSSQAILIVWSKRAGKYEYSVTTANFLVETLKCALSLLALTRIWKNDGVTDDNRLSTTYDEVKVFPIPAALYLFKNLLQYYIFAYVDAPGYQILKNLNIISTGVLYRIILKKKLSEIQWAGFILLCCGCTTAQLNSNSDRVLQTSLPGWIMAIIMALLSGFAGVYTEAIIKKRPSRNINVQNFWLYVFGMAFNAVAIVIQDFDAVTNKGFFHGYSFITVLMILNHAALTCAARLGLASRILAKVADDSQGRWMLEELESSGVDTSFCVTAKDGVSHFNYVIVDNQTNTRTCVFTPGYPPLLPDDLTESLLSDVLDRVRVIHVTGRSRETELLLAQKAHSKNVSILINAEKRREGLDKLLDLADYAVCSTHFPQDWTESPSSPSALLSMLIRLPKLKFVIMTLGEDGCVMLERCPNEVPESEEETDIDELHESLKQSTDFTSVLPVCNSSMVTRLKGNVTGRLYIVTAEKIRSSELMDTTGAGDAFTGGLLYGLCTDMTLEETLTFASRVAACCCRGLGARTTLPFRTDPNLAAFLGA